MRFPEDGHQHVALAVQFDLVERNLLPPVVAMMRPTSAHSELVWALVLKATAVKHGARLSIKVVERNLAGERFAPQGKRWTGAPTGS